MSMPAYLFLRRDCSPVRGIPLRDVPDAVCASPGARDDVFLPFNIDVGSQHFPENVQFGPTESLALSSRHTNRAVVLDEKKASVPGWLDLSHVAFLSSHAS